MTPMLYKNSKLNIKKALFCILLLLSACENKLPKCNDDKTLVETRKKVITIFEKELGQSIASASYIINLKDIRTIKYDGEENVYFCECDVFIKNISNSKEALSTLKYKVLKIDKGGFKIVLL